MPDEPTSDEAPTDTELVQRANAGDARAFDVLYERHRDWVVGLAYRFTRHRDDALDVLQETFRYFFGKFPGFELRAQLRTFLYPVIRNHSIGLARKKRPHLPGDEVVAGAAGVREERGDSREELAACLGRLPEGQREVLLLRFVDDLSLQEIADWLRIPQGTVKSRLHNALKTLREDPGTHDWFG